MLTYGFANKTGSYVKGNKGRDCDFLPENPRRGHRKLQYRNLRRLLKKRGRRQGQQEIREQLNNMEGDLQ